MTTQERLLQVIALELTAICLALVYAAYVIDKRADAVGEAVDKVTGSPLLRLFK